MGEFYDRFPWFDEVTRILVYFATAGLASALLRQIIRRTLRLGGLIPKGRQPSPERLNTVRVLVSSAITLIFFIIATLASLGLFIEPDTLAWMVGLFSAAFGLGARPLISDYLSGLSFIFEDTFAVGEKIEIPNPSPMEGVVEAINLRATHLRSPTGELYVVPNGEIRIVRNFSRGKFSIANVTIKIPASDLGDTLTILETLGKEAVYLLPNLIEPWKVISPEGVIGQYTELTLVAKARFGKASEIRPRLLTLLQEKLAEADILLAD